MSDNKIFCLVICLIIKNIKNNQHVNHQKLHLNIIKKYLKDNNIITHTVYLP